jgi:dephospho-CoA kinase
MTAIVGLSGGIGSGKSTVSAMLEKLGATLIDADALVHELQAVGSPMLRAIASAFGEHVIRDDGSLDREAVAEIVFKDGSARTKLGHIVHGPVIAEMMRRAAAARDAGVDVVVLDIPLLFEGRRSGSRGASAMDFEAIVLVYVPVEVQIERQMSRDGCDRAQALSRIAAQMPIEEKKALADIVIDNSGSLEETGTQVKELYLRLAGADG